MGFFSKGLKNEFETAVVNEPSAFELLKFYCICVCSNSDIQKIDKLLRVHHIIAGIVCLRASSFRRGVGKGGR